MPFPRVPNPKPRTCVNIYCPDMHTWKVAGVLAEGDTSRSQLFIDCLKKYIAARGADLAERLRVARQLGNEHEVKRLEKQLSRAGMTPPPLPAAPPTEVYGDVRTVRTSDLPRGWRNVR